MIDATAFGGRIAAVLIHPVPHTSSRSSIVIQEGGTLLLSG
jgi:hypothetical protein